VREFCADFPVPGHARLDYGDLELPVEPEIARPGNVPSPS
jgi:hypothetical protein